MDSLKIELLDDKGYLTIWYDPRGIIIGKWNGFFSNQNFREGCELLLHHIVSRKCTHGLDDAKEAKGSFLQNMGWIKENMLPKFNVSGLKKVAYVVPTELSTQRSFNRAIEIEKVYEMQLFESFSSAGEWLLSDFEDKRPFKFPKNKLDVKSDSERTIIDVHDIHYLFVHEKGTAIEHIDGLFYSNLPISAVLTQLPEYFIQVHRSYVINSRQIHSIKYYQSGSYHVFLKHLTRIKIPVSAKYAPALKHMLKLH